MLCNPNTHAVHSKVALKYSVARSKSYTSLSTLLTVIPCYTGHVYTPVRFSCNLYSRFFQCKILIYVHPQKTTIPALFWTVLVSVDQEFL